MSILISVFSVVTQSRFDSHAPDAHPFGLPVHLALLPAGKVQSGGLAPSR
jgi:hypothetical protein